MPEILTKVYQLDGAMKVELQPVTDSQEVKAVLLFAVRDHGECVGKHSVIEKGDDLNSFLLTIVIIAVVVEPILLVRDVGHIRLILCFAVWHFATVKCWRLGVFGLRTSTNKIRTYFGIRHSLGRFLTLLTLTLYLSLSRANAPQKTPERGSASEHLLETFIKIGCRRGS